ncbi:MAG TPA: chemotaxis protein CheW [Pyrinomonadaceae bacterium]|nr:chemotaxis protein CheW [Pyrinomonadaceae bacterium]
MKDTTHNQEKYFEPVPERVRTLQLLRAGAYQFAIFADEIAAIAPWQQPTPLPHSPQSVLGVVSIQGRLLTVLDLALITGQESSAIQGDENSGRHIIALRGDEQLALAVDDVSNTLVPAAGDFVEHAETAPAFVHRLLRCNGGNIIVLNLKELFPAAIHGRERRRRSF